MALARARARGKPSPSPLSTAAQAPDRELASRVEFRLPRPISKNRLRRLGQGREYAAPEYARWKTDCGWILQTHQPRLRCVFGPYRLMITLCANEFGRMDVGNAETAISDLLQAHRIVRNDRDAIEVTSRWGDESGVGIIVEAAEARP